MLDNDLSLRNRKPPQQKSQNGHIHENGSMRPFTRTNPADRDPYSSSTTSTALDILKIYLPTLLLIFGGCCSNVYTLESLISTSPASGPLITAVQFVLTALITLPSQISWRGLSIRRRAIPLEKWIKYTAFFLSINILNNVAFRYRISVPLHIILRSAGPVSTMLVGRVIGGKTYPLRKVVAVMFLFGGVVCAAISDAHSKVQDQTKASSNSKSSSWDQLPGFALLTLALFLSALMGLFSDKLYATYGRSGAIAAETLFYSHGLSLPFFALQWTGLLDEFRFLISSSTTTASSVSALSTIKSSPVFLLLLNATTQYICISGVNMLSARSSSLTVAIVLNIRKLVSLLLSIWIFGNDLATGVMWGAAMVFLGGGLYALPSSSSNRSAIEDKEKKDKEK